MNTLEEFERREAFIRQWKKDHLHEGLVIIGAVVLVVIFLVPATLETVGLLEGLVGIFLVLLIPISILGVWHIVSNYLPNRAYKRHTHKSL